MNCRLRALAVLSALAGVRYERAAPWRTAAAAALPPLGGTPAWQDACRVATAWRK